MNRLYSEFLYFFRLASLIWAWLFLACSVECSYLPPKGYGIREAAIVIGVVVGCVCFWGKIDYVGFREWRFAAVLGVGLIALEFWQYKMNWLPVYHSPASYWLMQVWFYILVGCNEELWFRGLWFAQFRKHLWLSVLGGAFVFGMFHVLGNVIECFWHGTSLPADALDRLILMTVGGIFFGIARHRGASVLMVAIPHTLVDLTDKMVGGSSGLRFPPLIKALGANLPIYLFLLALLFWCPTKPPKPDVD